MFDVKKVMQTIAKDINTDVERRWRNSLANLRLAGYNPDDYQMVVAQSAVNTSRKDGVDMTPAEEDCIKRGMAS